MCVCVGDVKRESVCVGHVQVGVTVTDGDDSDGGRGEILLSLAAHVALSCLRLLPSLSLSLSFPPSSLPPSLPLPPSLESRPILPSAFPVSPAPVP